MAIDIITAPVDGHAFVDYELLLPSGRASTLTETVRFQTATFVESAYGYSESNLTLRALTSTYVDHVLKSLEFGGSPLVRFRIGQGSPDHRIWTPWQIHYVTHYRGFFEGIGAGAGHTLNLHTQDLLAMVDRISRTSSHRGTISSIVKRIAERNGLSQTIIEPTHGEGVWIQSYEGDFEFTRQRLIRVARSAQNRGNYLLFSRDNVLHFHTVEYQADIKELSYYDSPASELQLSALTQEKIDMGSAGVRLVGHDPYTGQSNEAISSPAHAVRYGNWMSKLGEVNGVQRNYPFHLGENRGVEALNLAQNMYEFARQESYQLQLTTRKTKLLRPGDILNLTIEPKTGQASTWSGLWFVASGRHLIEKGEIISVYGLQRGELMTLKGLPNTPETQGLNLIPDEQNAQGIPINLQAAQASQLTRGAGKAVGSGIFSQVQDRTKAPVPVTPKS